MSNETNLNNVAVDSSVEEGFQNKFGAFLKSLESCGEIPTNMTSSGVKTIQQAVRNKIRQQGVQALLDDFRAIYGDSAEILETEGGIVFAVETDDGKGFTLSWEIKSTIKSTDYDPFIDAANYDEKKANKEESRLRKEREQKEHEETAKRKREELLAKLEKNKSKLNLQ